MATETVQRFPKGARVSIFFTPEMVEQLPWPLCTAVAKDHPGYVFGYENDGHALVILDGLGTVLSVPEWCVTRG